MHNPDATAILKTLIEGREPGSLEPLPTGSVVHHADVLRAMLAAVGARLQRMRLLSPEDRLTRGGFGAEP